LASNPKSYLRIRDCQLIDCARPNFPEQFVEQTDELAAACRRSTQTIFPVAHKRHPPAPILDREKEEPITIRFAATRKQSRGFPHRSSTQNKLERVTFNEREGFLGGRGIPTIAA